MTIAICNGKGGAGKTTLAVLLLLALRQSGRPALLLDRDPQGTASRWLETLEQSKMDPSGATRPIRIIDTAPQLSAPSLAASLQEADLAILVSSASPADLWTSQDTVAIIRAHLPTGNPARLLFNQVQRHTLLGRNLDNLSGRIGLPPFSGHLGRRQAYQHAAILGWDALDAPAREELLSLTEEIISLIPHHD